jgi:hypothetical protein
MEQLKLFEREEKRGARLTTRDMTVLRWLVEQRAATVAQVTTLLLQITGTAQLSDRRVRQIVSRWENLGLVTRWNVWHGEPAVILPTGQAAKMFGYQRWRRPGIGILRHTVAVAEIRLRTTPHGGNRQWVSETELRRHTAIGEHLADGGWFEDGIATAIEVELSPHGRKRVEATIKALLYAQVGGKNRWERVLYVCSPTTFVQVSAVRDGLAPAEHSRVIVRPMP